MLGKSLLVNNLEGVLLIDKPSQCTSHDVVNRIRKKLKIQKIGHAGTLDPLATGLLILMIGKATKMSRHLMTLNKEYTGVIKLGEVTDTQDSNGKIIQTKKVPKLTINKLQKIMDTFLGEQFQIPPMFSAKKIQGIPLYKLARKGKIVPRNPQHIKISKFKVESYSLPQIIFNLNCSKGTYVRTIANDLGQKLQCGAHLKKLRRLKTDFFDIDQCIQLEKLEKMKFFQIVKYLIPISKVVSHVL